MRATGRRRDRFALGLLLVCTVALGIRVGYVAFAKRGPCPIVDAQDRTVAVYQSECTGQFPNRPNDQAWYNFMGNQIAAGNGFTNPLPPHEAWADHPPLTPLVLSVASFVFDHAPFDRWADVAVFTDGKRDATHVREQRYLMALIGTVNVALIGLLARRVGGSGAGLLAASAAALYPALWVNDGLLFAETIAITCVVLAMLAALRAASRGRPRDYALLGLAIGAATLARSELLVLVVLLGVPAGLARRRGVGNGRMLARALGRVAVVGFCAVVVLAPWFAYNRGRFANTVVVSTNDGLALSGSNCDPVYYGKAIGMWSTEGTCSFTPGEAARIGDQSRVSAAYRERAFTYIGDHTKRLPLVVAARLGRTWSLFDLQRMVDYNEGENREPLVSWLALGGYYALVVGSLVGLWALWSCGERRVLLVLVAPIISVTLVTIATYGQTRFRATAEPSLVILASLGAVWIVDAIQRRRRARHRPAHPSTDHRDVEVSTPRP